MLHATVLVWLAKVLKYNLAVKYILTKKWYIESKPVYTDINTVDNTEVLFIVYIEDTFTNGGAVVISCV